MQYKLHHYPLVCPPPPPSPDDASSLICIAVGCLPPQMSAPPHPSSPSRPVQASVTPRVSCESSCYPLTHRSVGGHSNPVVCGCRLVTFSSTTTAKASSLLHASAAALSIVTVSQSAGKSVDRGCGRSWLGYYRAEGTLRCVGWAFRSLL